MASALPDSAASYEQAVAARRSRFRPSRDSLSRSSTYSIDPVFTIPHSGTHIHAFAAPSCSSHLYTGGSDGFVRRYALHATLNGTGVDNPLVPNLTSKPGGHERPPGTDMRSAVLSGYWENEEPGDWMEDLLSPDGEPQHDKLAKVKWGPKSSALGPQSAVHSLAVQREELWGLSGTSRGSINLWTVRHDEGQIRHVFRPDASSSSSSSATPQGHSPKAAVSALALDNDEMGFLSGGWDGRISEWDLHTGSSTRFFHAHNAQTTSLAFRPFRPPIPLATGDVDVERREEAEGEWVDAPGRVRVDEAGGEGKRKGAEKGQEANGADEDEDADADADADAEGEVDDLTNPHSILPSRPDPGKDVPVVGAGKADQGELSSDVFISTGLDGTVVLWDRRVGEGQGGPKGAVGKFAAFDGRGGKSGARCTSACWSPSGSHIYVARRSPSIQIYDLRSSSPLSTLSLPTSTGPVSAVTALPNGRHLLSASWDCVRLWDVERAMEAVAAGTTTSAGGVKATMPAGATVVPGHYGGTVSQLHVDPTCRWMFTTSGNRAWEGTSTENLVIHEIKTVA
ncbi:Transcription factor SPT8 [Rhodotorula toruloides]|nr:Transcription factor SPT8 [Rhodotorula toruloides]